MDNTDTVLRKKSMMLKMNIVRHLHISDTYGVDVKSIFWINISRNWYCVFVWQVVDITLKGKGCWENWHELVKGSLAPHINSKQTSTPGGQDILLLCEGRKGKQEKITTKKRTKATSGFIFNSCKGNSGTSVLIYWIIEELYLSLFLPYIPDTFIL